MCQLTNFRTSNEETESKIGIYGKKLSKIGPFENFNFWSKVNAKVKVNGLGQSQRVCESDPDVQGGSVQVNGQLGDVVLTRRHYWRGELTWLITWLGLTRWWRQLRLTCHLMMSSGDTSWKTSDEGWSCFSVRGWMWRRVAGTPRGACGPVQHQIRARFSGFVDRQTIRPTWRHVWPESDQGVKNPWWRVWGEPKPMSVHTAVDGDEFLGFWSR